MPHVAAEDTPTGPTAAGGPGLPARWTTGAKQGIGTANAAASRGATDGAWHGRDDVVAVAGAAPTAGT